MKETEKQNKEGTKQSKPKEPAKEPEKKGEKKVLPLKKKDEEKPKRPNLFVRLITFFWLAILYAGTIWMMLGTLSSYKFQENVEQAQADYETGDPDTADLLTVPNILDHLELIQSFEQRKQTATESSVKLKQLYNETYGLTRKEKRELIKVQDDLEKAEFDIALKIQALEKKGELEGEYESEELKIEDAANIDDSILKLVKQRNDLQAKIDDAKESAEWAQKEHEEAEEKLAEITTELQKIDEEMEEAVGGPLHDFLMEVLYLRKFGFDQLATMPKELLVFVLCMSMGALGSVIFLTRTFFNKDHGKPFTWFIFRPFLGMIMAIAIFILTKSGMDVLGGGEGLDPYFISFISIISGVLSEQAFLKIQEAGMDFFKVENKETLRWAVHVKEEMEKQGKTIEDLMPYTSASEIEMEKWVEEKKPVPEEQQELISVWLEKPPRALFSDQKPGDPEKEEGSD